MSQRSTRREFIKQSSALGAAFWVGGQSLLAAEKSPMEKLNFASIGVGGKGSSDSADAAKHGNLVAICDIDDKRLAKAAARYPKAKKFNDYREMLTEMDGDIDAVTVSTPDHSHAPASVMAMKKGKHCFTQKPLTWSVKEARVMRETANEHGVATQMGNQGTAKNGFRDAVEVIRSGVLGNVREAHVWTNRPVWGKGVERPPEGEPAPKHIHWDLFLGPAPYREFSTLYHPFEWRGWLDFGTGALGDMACHTMNMHVMALDLYDPKSIVAEQEGMIENETYPKSTKITYQFGERGEGGKICPLKLTWYDGGNKPPEEILMGEKMKSSGVVLVGDEGNLYTPDDYGAEYVLLPRDKFKDFKKPEQSLPRSPGHFEEFVVACKGGDPAMSNFNYASRLTETTLLGNVAIRAGKKLDWDAKKMEFTNAPEANKFLSRDYRDGWSL
ncbi:Gfo/Idh/MocA family oxidoreductase [uncultured Gimesia sp.]|uniref:Gfo/Idh/MocA family protein n=1 Tax=uncultured Gimesia sp. TaxID=1678688 RepID=UPI0030DC5FCA|tara:strand:- start:17305 stop:18630 length:1326 start_codon:yes stop_codon:yes gene_type:complete